MTDSGIDFRQFRQICMQAVNDDNTFKTFKRHPQYTGILEHVSLEQGIQYIDEIRKNNPQLLEMQYVNQFKLNDLIGSPVTYNFAIGTLSPTILRYVNVLSQLMTLFKKLDDMTIVEIGAGNGGQCSIISKVFNFKEYILIDLPEVLELQKKCISYMKVPRVTYLVEPELDVLVEKEIDLVISNYALSECPDNIKESYINKILLKSKRGYLTMNREDRTKFKVNFLGALSVMHPVVLNETPLTSCENYIIVWG